MVKHRQLWQYSKHGNLHIVNNGEMIWFQYRGNHKLVRFFLLCGGQKYGFQYGTKSVLGGYSIIELDIPYLVWEVLHN